MKRDYDSPANRMRQLQRVLVLISLISPLRYGASIAELHRDMVSEYDDMCERTVRRDLIALEQMGMVQKEFVDGGVRWKWMRQARTERIAATAERWPMFPRPQHRSDRLSTSMAEAFG